MTGTTLASIARKAELGIRNAILAVFVVGVRQRNWGAMVNAIIAFAATYAPDLVERRWDVELRPWQRVYAETAMLTHAVGMLGLYDDTWWWDHVTHVHSSTLLGGFVHAAARRGGRDPRPRVLAATVVVGVLWELAEYVIHAVADRLGLEPVLVHYGERDTLFDLLFNLVGAFLVLAFGDHLLRNVSRHAD